MFLMVECSCDCGCSVHVFVAAVFVVVECSCVCGCRDELLRCLTIIQHCLLGAACLLPVLQGEQTPL